MQFPATRIARFLLLILLTLAAAPAFAGINRWTPFGPGGGSIGDVVLDPRSPETLWITSAGTVYKSEDGGTSWHPRRAASRARLPSSWRSIRGSRT